MVRDNMILNMHGIPGKGEGVDMNMEHLIGRVKVCRRILLETTYLIPGCCCAGAVYSERCSWLLGPTRKYLCIY